MLGEETDLPVSESLANLVENLACRVARSTGGWVTPVHLLPHAPLSLGLITHCLDGMVDDVGVLRDDRDGRIGFLFTAYQGAPEDGAIRFDTCPACGADSDEGEGTLCAACDEKLDEELIRLARKMGWPSQAAPEHEITYLAAGVDGPVRAEYLAGRSPATLRAMKRRLRDLTVQGYIRQDLDSERGAVTCRFPAVRYDEADYRRNRRRIASYPASFEEELEMKVVRIAITLGVLLLLLFAMAFMKVPYPLLVTAFLVAAPVVAVYTLRHRSRVEAD